MDEVDGPRRHCECLDPLSRMRFEQGALHVVLLPCGDVRVCLTTAHEDTRANPWRLLYWTEVGDPARSESRPPRLRELCGQRTVEPTGRGVRRLLQPERRSVRRGCLRRHACDRGRPARGQQQAEVSPGGLARDTDWRVRAHLGADEI